MVAADDGADQMSTGLEARLAELERRVADLEAMEGVRRTLCPYARATTPTRTSASTAEIFRGIVPFLYVQLVNVAVIMLFPQVVLWLPRTMGLTK